MRSASLLVITQIQDYLALAEDLRAADPRDERVNVPGTVGTHNWSYRLPVTVETLEAHQGLAATIRELLAAGGRAEGPS
jgi:4-alpha-glucanotransferase